MRIESTRSVHERADELIWDSEDQMSDLIGLNRRSHGFGAVAFMIALGLALSPATAQPTPESHDHSQHGTPADNHPHHTKQQDHSRHQPAAGAKKKKAVLAKTKKPAKHGGHPASPGARRHASPGKQATHGEHGGAHDEH